MRIAAIGYYGFGNAGDERILACLRAYYRHHEIVPVAGWGDFKKRWDEVNRCDVVIFGGGGLVLRGTGRHAPLFERLTTPLVCLGISVEAQHADNADLIEVLKCKSRYIQVRDEASHEAFGTAAHVHCGPDLTFSDPFPVSRTLGTRDLALNLRPWVYWRSEHSGKFDRWMRRYGNTAVMRRLYPLRRWRPENIARVVSGHGGTVLPVPMQISGDGHCDCNFLKRFVPNVPARFDESQIAKAAGFISMRLHGLIFACQTGTPFVSLAYQPKCSAFCKAAGMSEFAVDLFARGRTLARSIERLLEERSQIRERLLTFREKSYKLVREQLANAL